MGNAPSRPEEEESMGIAELFTVKPARHYPLPRCLRRWLIKLRLAAHTRVPATHRQRGLESIDSMGEARAILSAMGGWEEARAGKRYSTLDSRRGWAGVYARG